jgi:hypothetical protein
MSPFQGDLCDFVGRFPETSDDQNEDAFQEHLISENAGNSPFS